MHKGIQSLSLGRLTREIIFRKQHSKLWTGQLVKLLADDSDTEVRPGSDTDFSSVPNLIE